MTIVRESTNQEYEITSADSERVEFPFEFSAKERTQIHCFDVNPDLPDDDPGYSVEIPSSDFNVAAASGGLTYGGVITLAYPLTVGHVLDIQRTTPKTQTKSFSNQARIIPEEIEDALDRTVMMVQESQSASNAPLIADIDSLKAADVVLQNQITSLGVNKANASELNNYATNDALSSGLATKANASHTQPISSITNLQTTLDVKLEDSPSDGKTYGRKDGSWAESGSGGLPSGGTPGDLLVNTGDGAGAWESVNSTTERMPKTSASVFGVVKIDGTTIVESGGVITSVGGGGGGTTDHRALTHREDASQHPDTAITHGANTVYNVIESQATAISSKANAADLANYALNTALNDGLATKANTSHTHSMDQVTDLNDSLAGKAELSHSHNQSDIINLSSSLAEKASLTSPVFVGTPSAPTATAGTNNNQIATTEFVQAALQGTKLINYSVTEQWTGRLWIDGKKVYLKTIDFGSLPNNARKNVAHSITNLAYVISLDFITNDSDGTRNPVPMSTYLLGWVSNTDVTCQTTINLSLQYAYVTLNYTCTDR